MDALVSTACVATRMSTFAPDEQRNGKVYCDLNIVLPYVPMTPGTVCLCWALSLSCGTHACGDYEARHTTYLKDERCRISTFPAFTSSSNTCRAFPLTLPVSSSTLRLPSPSGR